MNNKWCKDCKGRYPVFICGLTGRLATEYEIRNHCISGGKECQKKIEAKALKLKKGKGDNNGKLV